jgi:head-tail adaptor
MRIGKADRRVTLQQVSYTRNDYGEAIKGYTTLTSVWAELLKTGNIGESIKEGQDIAVKRLHFKVRSSTDTRAITAGDRLQYASDNFDILGVEEIGRKDQLVYIVQSTTTQ